MSRTQNEIFLIINCVSSLINEPLAQSITGGWGSAVRDDHISETDVTIKVSVVRDGTTDPDNEDMFYALKGSEEARRRAAGCDESRIPRVTRRCRHRKLRRYNSMAPQVPERVHVGLA